MNAYAYWNSAIYTEVGVYWTPSRGFLRAMGSDTYDGGPVLSDATPYARVAYQKDYGDQNFEVGTFGLFPQLNPGGAAGTASDNYADVGLDASYQYIGDSSGIFSIALNRGPRPSRRWKPGIIPLFPAISASSRCSYTWRIVWVSAVTSGSNQVHSLESRPSGGAGSGTGTSHAGSRYPSSAEQNSAAGPFPVVMIGLPQAMASIRGIPNPSPR